MRELEYPFNAKEILKKKKAYKRQLVSDTSASFDEKRIAILGGQTTQNIRLVLELFLLNHGIKAIFYESEYNKFYEDGVFDNQKLKEFSPDIIYVCTCIRNIESFPLISDNVENVDSKRRFVVDKFVGLWDSLRNRYHCPVIQNNFEYPFFRLMGNMDASDYRGRVNFVTKINCDFYDYAQRHENFYICDVNYISASYGLEKWADPYYWYMYKYAVSVPAIPYLSFNVANIIKALYGRNKKAFNLDLDNTLWGGTIGDDGADNIEIGQETSLAQSYSEFQKYIKLHKQLGIMLTVNSKNDVNTAQSGFKRSDNVLNLEDFTSFKANWNPKSENLAKTAAEMTLLPESFVFVDDNPAERAIIERDFPGVAIPEISDVEHFIRMIDKSGYFEVTSLSDDDIRRNEMYLENTSRQQLQASFSNYEDYLKSLEMKGEIQAFVPEYMSRIAQLTNKSNQFNLTTHRYSQGEIETVANNPKYITLYGKLTDKFGDNGVVSVLIGRIDGENNDELHMELWIMSCRVLKRDMEYAMMDKLVEKSKSVGIKRIFGYFYPTAKNSMVKDFYALQGFKKLSEDADGNTIWKYDIPLYYEKKQSVIEVVN